MQFSTLKDHEHSSVRKVNLGAVPENGGTWSIPPRNLLKLPMYANLLGPGKMMIKQFEHLDLSLILEKIGSKTGDALDKVQLGRSFSFPEVRTL